MRLVTSLFLLGATLFGQVIPRSSASATEWAAPFLLGSARSSGIVLLSLYDQGGGVPRDMTSEVATATFTGTVTWVQAGNGSAISTGGTNGNYVDWGNPSKLQDFIHATGSFTICSAFTIDGGDGAARSLLRKQNAAVLWLWRIDSSNTMELQFGNSASTLGDINSVTTLTADPQRVRTACVARDQPADKLYMYVDGRLDNTVTDPSVGFAANVTSGNVRSCNQAGTNNECWNGKKLVDIAWARRITDGEAAMFHERVMNSYPMPELARFGSLVTTTFPAAILNNPIVQ